MPRTNENNPTKMAGLLAETGNQKTCLFLEILLGKGGFGIGSLVGSLLH